MVVMRCVFTASLFSVFVYKFGYPCYKQYLARGVITMTSWTRREDSDWPAITFCPLDKNTGHGWRNISLKMEDSTKPWTDRFCGEEENMEDALDCLHKRTFDLNETIQTLNGSWNLLNTSNVFWSWDMTDITRHGNAMILHIAEV